MGEIHEILRAALEKRRDLAAAEFKRAIDVDFGNRPAADEPCARGRIDALHRREIILVERRERERAGFEHSSGDFVQFAAVFLKPPLLGGRGPLHFKLNENVVAAAQALKHLFDRRHRFRAVFKSALPDFGKRQFLDDAFAVGGALKSRVVHNDEMSVLGHADIDLETGHSRVQALRETAGGVVLIFAARTAVRENARSFNVVFDLPAPCTQSLDDLLRKR